MGISDGSGTNPGQDRIVRSQRLWRNAQHGRRPGGPDMPTALAAPAVHSDLGGIARESVTDGCTLLGIPSAKPTRNSNGLFKLFKLSIVFRRPD